MTITRWVGDLTKLDEPGIIAHQVNTETMGAGLAKSLYGKWREVRLSHQKKAKSEEGWDLGEVQLLLVDASLGIYVANCCGQVNTTAGRDNCNYKAIEKYLWRVFCLGMALDLPVLVPDELGSGLAGGNQAHIHQLMGDRFSVGGDLRIVTYKPGSDLVPNA
jgi:hypothetical protein